MPIFSMEFRYILFYLFSFFWLIELIVFKPQYKGLNYINKPSFRTVFIVIFTIIVGTLLYNHFELFLLPDYTFVYFNYTGIFIYAIGLVLRYYTRITLSKNFTRKVKVSSNQKLVSDGPYRLLAHPLYLGQFLLLLAIPVYFGQVIWIFATILFFGKVILNRMKEEERTLTD
jgi:protein-S-isoprenylcysteine O-methyltransferase Ste14